MRFALSVLGPALFSTLPLIGGATALVLSTPAPVHAQEGGEDDPNLEELEEQVLRQQIEQYLNEFARWDDQKHRIVIGRPGQEEQAERAKQELGPLQPLAEMLIQRMIERGDDGRLKVKDSMKLRPFAKAIQDYIADGGIEDIEKFQRYRNGDGENPFKKGIPPRVQKAMSALLKALNEQPSSPKAEPRRDEGDDRRDARRADEKRRAEEARRRAEDERRAGEEDRPAPRREPSLFQRRDTRPAPGAGEQQQGDRLQAMKERIAKRFDMEPEEVDELLRYVREMTRQGQDDLSRMRDEMRIRIEEFQRSDRGREMQDRVARLQRRAEDELRRFLESDETRERLSQLEQRAMDFLASEEGQQMQRKILEFLASEDGAKVREKLGEFMASDRGRDLLKKLGERFGGGGDRDRDRERRVEPRANPADEARRQAEQARKAVDEARQELEARRKALEERLRADERRLEELKRDGQGEERREAPRARRDGRRPQEF